MPQLATISQFYEFQGIETPTLGDAEQMKLNADLRRGSTAVMAYLRRHGAKITWAPTGFPQNGYIAQELAHAAVAYVIWYRAALGDVSGAGSDFDTASIIGVSFGKRSGQGSQTNVAANRVAPEALEILQAIPYIWSTRVNRAV